LDGGPARLYHWRATEIAAALPRQTRVAAPDTFRLVAFDTPLRYHFTHDMVARHVEHLTLGQAAWRDACATGADVLVETRDSAAEPGMVLFHLRRLDAAALQTCGRRIVG